MSVPRGTTLKQLRDHFDRESYIQAIKDCASKRTDATTLESIQRDYFASDSEERLAVWRKNGMTVQDLGRIMQYKLSRGKWRPRLQQLVESNDAENVQDVTKSAIQPNSNQPLSMDDIEDRMTRLTSLKAVGPATASLILTLFFPCVPFFGDELAAFHLSGQDKLKYTLKEYLLLVEENRKWIEQQSRLDENKGTRISPKQVEEMVWYRARRPETKTTSSDAAPDGKEGEVRKRRPAADEPEGRRKSVRK